MRAERDVLQNALNAELAQIDSEIAAKEVERESTSAFYQATIDARNLDINLLATPADSSASSTPDAVNNDEQIAAFRAEIAQAEADRANALAELDEKVAGLRIDRDALVAQRQPDIDGLNVRIADLESDATVTTTTVIPSGLSEELEALRSKVVVMEHDYANELNKLEGLLASVDRELNDLYGSGSSPADDIYRQIDDLNGQLNTLGQASDQRQVQQNDAVNNLVGEAERLQQELNARTRHIEEQLFEIDDALQRLYRGGETDRYDHQITYNEAQRALEDRRYELDDRRWLLDQEQQDMYSNQQDPYMEIQEKADLIYATEVQPLQDRINQLEDEMRRFWDEEQSLERQMRIAEQTIRDRERELEDQVFDILDAATSDQTLGNGTALEGLIEGAINPVTEPLDDAGAPEPINEPADTSSSVNADGTVVEETVEPEVAPVQ